MAGFTKSKLHILSLLSSRGLSASAQPQKFETITVSNGYNVGQMLSWRVILEPALALDSRSRPNYRSYGEENNQEIGNYKVFYGDAYPRRPKDSLQRIRIIEILMDEITHRQGFAEKECSCEHLAMSLLNISIYPQTSF